MMKSLCLLLLVLLICLTMTANSQSKYEKGYFIDSENNRTECLILNLDWRFNPTGILVKSTETDEPKQVDIFFIKEFQVYGFEKYVRANVILDVSSSNIQNLSSDRFPEWEKRKVFLKVIAEGQATLYTYQQNQLTRFFFKVGDSIKQLIYKKYFYKNPDATRNENINNVASNNDFRKQLMRYFPLALTDYNKIDYNSKDLAEYFTNYNMQQEGLLKSEPQDTSIILKHDAQTRVQQRQSKISFGLTTGYQYTHWSILEDYNYETAKINPSNHGVRLGASLEISIPYHHNVWSFILEPSYSINEGNLIKYRTVTVPFGMRYTARSSATARFYCEAMLASRALEIGKAEVNSKRNYELDYFPSTGFVVGAGYRILNNQVEKPNNKQGFRIGIQFSARTNALNNYYYSGDLQTVSLIVGYTF